MYRGYQLTMVTLHYTFNDMKDNTIPWIQVYFTKILAFLLTGKSYKLATFLYLWLSIFYLSGIFSIQKSKIKQKIRNINLLVYRPISIYVIFRLNVPRIIWSIYATLSKVNMSGGSWAYIPSVYLHILSSFVIVPLLDQ